MQDPSHRVLTQEEYLALCHKEWEWMDWAGVDRMIEQMPEQIPAFLRAKEGHTKYS
jgi:hypothetical protein